MPRPNPLQTTAHGLLDVKFQKSNVVPSTLPGIYLAGIVPVVVLPVWLCVLAFGHSTLVGLIALLLLPIAILAGLVAIRMFLEILQTLAGLLQIMSRVIALIFGFHDTMADVTGPASVMATGIRAVQVPKRSVRKRRHRRDPAQS